MKDTILFNGLNALDAMDVRANVVRIPEVSRRIFEAQQVWDANKEENFNFYNFLISDDTLFLRNIKLKALAAAVVQVGLFDRYLKNFRQPEFLVGTANRDSALDVATGKKSFAELICQSEALNVPKPSAHLGLAEAEAPVLSGICLTEFDVYRLNTTDDGPQYERTEMGGMDCAKVLSHLIEEECVRKFVNIGPGSLLMNREQESFSLADIQILESVELDPMLSWFWPEVSRAKTLAG